jgi:chromosome segregation ATPase
MIAGTRASEVPVTAAEKAAQLDSQVQALDAQRGRLIQKRETATTTLQSARSSRALVCESLLTAAKADEAGIHKRLDALDSQICEGSRELEALDTAIGRADQEISGVQSQFAAAREQAAREELMRKDEAARAQFSETWNDIDEILDRLCIRLAEGVAGPAAMELKERQVSFAQARIGESLRRHNVRNINDGWRPQHGISPNLTIQLAPMLPPAGKR